MYLVVGYPIKVTQSIISRASAIKSATKVGTQFRVSKAEKVKVHGPD